ncbi:Peptidoglycan-associated lipoprotein [Nocardiopsis dassonvillei]|uniref:OmpA family protein n=1 Tax=Nocardiopsis dassonvillei TaxID=2014 RepID=UPI003F5713E1
MKQTPRNQSRSSQKNKRKQQKTRKLLAARITPLHVALILTSGCVISPEETSSGGIETPHPPGNSPSTPITPGEHPEVIASSTTSAAAIGSDLQVDIYALERVGGDLLRLRLGITNNSAENFTLYDGLASAEDKYTAAGVSLLDPQARSRHLSYRQSDGSCFCSALEGPLEAGATEEMWVIFPEPESDTASMTVTTPLTPPLPDIPITDSTEKLENSGLGEAEILPLTNISENIEGSTGRTESEEEVSILLSSDVLFETNSSNLNDEAEEILEQVALEVDDASATTVNIDGHADNTGSDVTNIPLSEERAEAVKEKLEELITREGINFEVKGHGSSDPIATNSTEEGRERNRRVSVTFEK